MSVIIGGTAGLTFNDASTQSTAAVINTTNILNATAGGAAGGVGTYAAAINNGGSVLYFGNTVAGSSLQSIPFGGNTGYSSAAFSGTWRCMGDCWNAGYGYNSATLFLRIS